MAFKIGSGRETILNGRIILNGGRSGSGGPGSFKIPPVLTKQHPATTILNILIILNVWVCFPPRHFFLAGEEF